MAVQVEFPIHRGPKDSSILSAVLFGPKGQNTEYLPHDLNPKAIFYIGDNPEQASPIHVTIRSVTAIDDWGVEYEMSGEAIEWNVVPMGYGSTTATKPFRVSLTYNLSEGTGVIKFLQKRSKWPF